MEGNQMKMREALQKIRKIADINICESVGDYSDKRIIEIADAALSAPPRQCDVGTAEEQADRFREFCKKGKLPQFAQSAYCARECSCRDAADCKFAWAQAPYAQEGAAK